MENSEKIKIPFSYFGGKRRVAKIIWSAFGEISNYIEPFCGSLSVLLSSPLIPKIETVNDIDANLTNFWRSISLDPGGVAKHADHPVSELDLHARQKFILDNSTPEFKKNLETNSEFIDAKMAGYWIYGQCASTGNNWLQPKGEKALPLLSSAGGGIHGLTYSIHEDFKTLQQRLRRVRITCGDWKRICTPALTYNSVGIGKNDVTGVFLDPPYSQENRHKVYSNESNVFKEVCDWAVANGERDKMRIIVCGYDGDYDFSNSWTKYTWNSSGMANLGNSRGRDNSKKETIWFSKNCLPPIT